MKVNLGAEPKKMAILGGLLLVAAYLLYSNFSGGTEAPSTPAVARKAPVAAAPQTPAPVTAPRSPENRRVATRGTDRSTQEFRPSLKPLRPEERRDPATIDPSLRLDLLAKLHNVKVEGAQRSLFEFSQPRAPKVPDVKILPKPGTPGAKVFGPPPPPDPKPEPAAPPKPPPPPITLKFYGFISPQKGGVKRAFFLDGDDIFVGAEGEIIKKRYKVVRIGNSSAVLEDVEFKHQQTVPLVQEQTG